MAVGIIPISQYVLPVKNFPVQMYSTGEFGILVKLWYHWGWWMSHLNLSPLPGHSWRELAVFGLGLSKTHAPWGILLFLLPVRARWGALADATMAYDFPWWCIDWSSFTNGLFTVISFRSWPQSEMKTKQKKNDTQGFINFFSLINC